MDGRRRVGCGAGVHPRIAVTVRVQVVQRQQLRVALAVVTGRGCDHVGGLRVQLAPQPERESLVRAVTHQRVAEPHARIVFASDEVAQAVPGRIVRAERRVDHGFEEIERERLPEHRRPAEHIAVARIETVDSSCDHRFDRVGKRFTLVSVECRRDELTQEQRVTARADDERLQLVGRNRCVGRSEVEQLRGRVEIQRRELDRGPGALGRGEAAVLGRGA